MPFVFPLDRSLVKDGVLLGAVFFYLRHTNIGLETIAANRAGFLIGLNVVMVPLLGPLVGHEFSIKALFSGAIVLFGLWLMSLENGTFAVGDLWMVVCALSYTVYILLLTRWRSAMPPSSLQRCRC